MAINNVWTKEEEYFMREAFVEATRALDEGEIPVGCVITKNGRIVARGSNKTNEMRNGTRHAEFIAIDKLIEASGSVEAAEFGKCDLYVTCEPCIMCAGALSLLGFHCVTHGCPNDKFGGNGSLIPVHEIGCGGCGKDEVMPEERKYITRGGLFMDEAIAILKDFYESGNPNAPKPHRRVLRKLSSAEETK